MTEEDFATLREYQRRFKREIPDSRLLSPDTFERLPILARQAIDRGEPLTDEELDLRADPGPEGVL